MTDGVDAAVEAVEPPGAYPAERRIGTDADPSELRGRDHAVLTCSDPGKLGFAGELFAHTANKSTSTVGSPPGVSPR
jgi:hypothetical protein